MQEEPSQLSKVQSNALRIVTFLATLLVVLRHSFNLHHYYPGGGPWMHGTDANIVFQQALINITNVAIPAFFFMSGFLFFRDIHTWQDCLTKWRKRIKTLFIPYLLWNLLLLILVICLSIVPSFRTQLKGSYGLDYSFRWILYKLTLYPIMGHFWYIRTLMLFLLCAPFLHILLQNNAISFIVLFILARCWKPIDTGIFSTEGALFFFCGSWMTYHGGLPVKYPWKYWIWLLIPIIYSLWPNTSLPGGTALYMYLGWQLCLYLAECPHISKYFLQFNQYSFFLYALHATIVSGLSLFLSHLLPHTPAYSFLAYLFCFLTTVSSCLFIAWLVKKLLPHAYFVLSGGR